MQAAVKSIALEICTLAADCTPAPSMWLLSVTRKR